MPRPIRVNPQELVRAAELVGDYAEQLCAGHASSTATAEGAAPGLVGQSAHAVDAKTLRWQTTTAGLHHVLATQADALASAAKAYAATEGNNRDAIASVDPTIL